VRLLNEAEKDAIREVKPAISFGAGWRVLEEVAKVAEVAVVKGGGRECVKIRPPDKSKVEEVADMLKAVGIKAWAERREVNAKMGSMEKIRRATPTFSIHFICLSSYLHFCP